MIALHYDYIVSMSTPSATVDFDKKILSEKWREIKNIVKDELPTEAELCEVMSKAGAAVNIADIGIEPELAVMGILYHPYMRHKITLSRLDAMTNLDLSKLLKI